MGSESGSGVCHVDHRSLGLEMVHTHLDHRMAWEQARATFRVCNRHDPSAFCHIRLWLVPNPENRNAHDPSPADHLYCNLGIVISSVLRTVRSEYSFVAWIFRGLPIVSNYILPLAGKLTHLASSDFRALLSCQSLVTCSTIMELNKPVGLLDCNLG